MKRPVRGHDGKYNMSGKKYSELFGSRQQVWNGTAYKTTGGLTKSQLIMNKWGRIVSADKYRERKIRLCQTHSQTSWIAKYANHWQRTDLGIFTPFHI
jgi:DVNP family